MPTVINSTYITLDGVIGGPHLWPPPGRPSDERCVQIQTDLLLSCDAVLLARRTYEGFAQAWVTHSGDPMSDHMNTMPKGVVHRRLRLPRGHSKRTSGPGSRLRHRRWPSASK